MAAMARFINNFFPSLQQCNGLKSLDLSHNIDVVNAYDDDPLVHGKVTPRLFVTTSEAGEYAIANAAKVKVPVLLMHGAQDNITSPEGTKAFHENLGARKAMKIYEGMYHEVHNEVENSLVLADMLQFFKENL